LEESSFSGGLLAVVALYFLFRLFRLKKRGRRASAFSKTIVEDVLMKGELGEKLVLRSLEVFEKRGARVLSNLYIPKTDDEETTEVDAVLIHRKGFFVIEVKNFNGWIFGNEKNKYWTQTLAVGRGRQSHKERFYNPLRQNGTHIKHLKRMLSQSVPMYSIIVFSDKCVLKDISVSTNKPNKIVQQHELVSLIEGIIDGEEEDIFTEQDVEWMFDELNAFVEVDDEIKRKHVEQQEKAKSENLS